MKAHFFRLMIVGVMLNLAYNASAHVGLDYPQGEETFVVGEVITIEWHIVAAHNTLNWDLFFSQDGGETWEAIQLDIDTSQLSYEWEVPDMLTSEGRIRIIQDNEDQNYQDNSMNFVITPNTSPPKLDAPSVDATIQCDYENQPLAIQAWLNNHGGAEVTNYCSNLIWSHDYPGISNGCGATGSAQVTFTAMDDCGLITSTATIMVVDISPPLLVVPSADMLVESDGVGNTNDLQAWLDAYGGAQATDLCGNATWTNNFSMLTEGCGSTGSATVIFTATDECDNSTTTSATFAIEDHLSPVIYADAESLTMDCMVPDQQVQIQQWLDIQAEAQASDIGSQVIWSNNYTGLSDSCGSTGMATVIFVATDECGNSNTTASDIIVKDETSPNINVAAQDTTIICGQDNQVSVIQSWLYRHGGASATDFCGELSWTHDFSSIADTCGPLGTHNINFTVTDECGNMRSTNAILTIMDTLVTAILKANELNFIIYPNPSNDVITLAFYHGEEYIVNIVLVDAFGKHIWTKAYLEKEVSFPVHSFSAGIYFLLIKTSRRSFLRKIIVK